MAVQPGPTFKRYAANGAATVYTIPFLLLDPANLQITLNGVPVTSGFTLAGLGNAASSCTFAVAPAGDLLFQQVMLFQRLTDYQMNGDFLSQTVNGDYDRLWLAIKQLNRDDGRSLAVSPLEPEGIPALPVKALRNLRLLAFDAAGNPAPSNLTLVQLEQQPALALESAAAANASALEASNSELQANNSATVAMDEASKAEASAQLADIALGTARVFKDVATGLLPENTISGQYFSVPSDNISEYLILYKNSDGVALEQRRYPSSIAVQDVLELVNPTPSESPYFAVADDAGNLRFVADNGGGFGTSSSYLHHDGLSTESMDISQSPVGGFQIADNQGLVIFQIDGDGNSTPAGAKAKGFYGETMGASELLLGSADIKNDPGAGFQFVDQHGFIALNVTPDGSFLVSTLPTPVSSSDELFIAMRNATNLAASAAVRGEFNSEVQRAVCKYNHILMYGQSLSTGYEGWPALSKTPFGGNLMYGDSTRPTGRQNGVFVPLGGAALKPLKAVVQSLSTGGVMTDAEVSALVPGAGNEGESPEVGAVNFARKLFLQYHGVASDSSRLFVASNCGVSGRTIEQLSKGAEPDLYPRLPQAVAGVRDIAVVEGATYCIPAILFMQGEYNYTGENGGDGTKAGYKAKLKVLAENWKSDLAYGLAGQSSPPAIITYQTGAGFTRDINDLAIGMAQLELSQEERNWYMATPTYPYTDKGGHLDSNGYRWLGAQMGKVLHRVVTLGQNWKPLSPRRVTVHEQEILLDFHVPCPPLVFDTPYVVLAANNYTDKGFRVIDSVGVVPLSSVSIINETMVRIVLSRTVAENPRVQYASQSTFAGNGNLRDSDDTISADLYVYQAGSGQYPGTNIPALVDKPYPLHNWCVAFSLTPEFI